MTRLIAAMLLGAALLAGGFALWRTIDSCLGRCAVGTRCERHLCVVEATVSTLPPVVKEPRRRTRSLSAAAELTLRPGDERMVAQGDALGRPEHLDLTSGNEAHDLTQEELDHVFKPAQNEISRCITSAVGNAPLEHGHVEVAFRVERSGAVKRVRIEAPALLQRQGLSHCVRGVVTALRFPVSGAANVMTYPFELK